MWVGHLRTPHTYGRIAQTYSWSHLREEVKQYVRSVEVAKRDPEK